MNILEKIIATNRAALNKAPLPERRRAVRPGCFAAALRRDGLNVIAELKKASPSKGLIREDFSPVNLAHELERAGAAALSVLTEKFYFQGSPAYLEQVAAQAQLPVLRKDFIFDDYQLAEAAAFGADAVLLIAAALPPELFRRLLDAARAFRLEVLAEVHTPAELDFVLSTDAAIIGINSRDLRTFKTDPELTRKMLISIPAAKVRVAESGIFGHADLVRLRNQGADGFLVGEALMSAASPGRKLRELLCVPN
ncbi:MAG: indole-3-glycerol phosphate synthase TrpC [Victivallaceae bacterium]|nr:indole-3-glycerol phosphate synthase TrpC [Victivallaceae bacterium]